MFSFEGLVDLPLIWYGLIATAIFLYILLDGFDLGVGILFPFAPTERCRDRMMNSVAPFWDGNETWLVLGGGGIVLGLATYGYRVMRTIGTKITALTPSSGFSATLAAATVVVLASRTGMPVSTTHIAVGAVMGVGMTSGVAAVDLRVIRDIVASWLITLPAGAIMAILFFFTLKGIFGISCPPCH